MKWVIILLILFCWPADCESHETWANGSKVPPWVKASCCGDEDVHHLTADDVEQVEGGYKIKDYPYIIPYAKALPSQDGDYWAFYKEYHMPDGGKTTYSQVFCFFAPMSM